MRAGAANNSCNCRRARSPAYGRQSPVAESQNGDRQPDRDCRCSTKQVAWQLRFPTRGRIVSEPEDRTPESAKAAEEQLRLLSNRLIVATKAGQIGIWDYDIATNVLVWDEQMYRLYGVAPEDFSGAYEAWESGLHPDDVAGESEKLLRAIRGEKEFDTEFRIIWPADGSVRYIKANATVLRDADGQAVRVIGTNLDITEQQRAEEELRVTSNRLLLATKAGEIGIWDFDITTNELVWDEQMYRLYGVAPENFSGAYEAWESGLHPDDVANESEKLQRAIRGEEEFDTEFRIIWPADGSVRFIKANATVLRDASGQAVRMIGTNWDTTEQRRGEQALLLAKQNAEAAVRTKSQFLANMSHEIRTPMNGIMGLTELLLRSDLNEEQRHYLDLIGQSAGSLLTIINDVLDVSRIEAGKMQLTNRSFNLRDSIGDTLQTVGLRAVEKGIELAYRVPPDVPELLVGDAGRIRQILVNLVGNALKFTEQGEVVVDVQLTSRTSDRASLRFQVHDTGIGIPANKLRSIFESFTQVEGSTTRSYGGTGLGLTICRDLVELMNGRIWVESQLGQGSTFHFTVTLGVGPAAAGSLDTPPRAIAGVRALVVDDNATNRNILSEMLTGWAIEAQSAASGAEALTKLAAAQDSAEPMQLVLLDTIMPTMDGLQVARRILDEFGEQAPAVFLLSPAGSTVAPSKLRKLGPDRVLTKPVKQIELLDAITDLFGQPPLVGSEQPRELVATPNAVRAMKVLVVDDGEVNLVLAVALLEARGHSVVVARDGIEAVDLHANQAFDAILMDVQMPKLDGYGATAIIRKQEATSGHHIPIIAMTANAMAGDRELCLKAGMDDYVAKPVQSEELFAVLERYAGGNAAH